MANFPIVLTPPTTNLVNSVIRIPVYQQGSIYKVAGYLRALSMGTFTVEIRKNSTLIDTLSWSSSGLIEHDINDESFDDGDIIRLDIGGMIPVGADDCTVILWLSGNA